MEPIQLEQDLHQSLPETSELPPEQRYSSQGVDRRMRIIRHNDRLKDSKVARRGHDELNAFLGC